MVESFGDLIRNGYGTWKGNLNICVPFIIRFFLIVAVFLAVLIPFALLGVFQMKSGPGSVQSNFSSGAEMMAGSTSLLFAAALIVGGLAALAIVSYFEAGAIGMAREVLEKRSTSLETMWASGKRHYVKMALSYILTALIWIAAVLVVSLPFFGAMAVPGISGLLFGLGFMIAFVVMLLVFLALALVPYALVIDDLGPVEAVEASIRFFREHQFDVLPIPIVVFVISLAIGIIGALLGLTGSMYVSVAWSLINQIIDQIVIASLATVWWTRLYLDRTGKMLNKEDASSNT